MEKDSAFITGTLEDSKRNSVAGDVEWLHEHGFKKARINGELVYYNSAFPFRNVLLDIVCKINTHILNPSQCDPENEWICYCQGTHRESTKMAVGRLIDEMHVRNGGKILLEDINFNSVVIESTRLNVLKLRCLEWVMYYHCTCAGSAEQSVRQWCAKMANTMDMIDTEIKRHPAEFWNKGYMDNEREACNGGY